MIEVKGLVKAYPGVRAVDGVSFSVAPGTCFGLLGPNGAGKTTIVEIMEGICVPDSGDVLYQGKPIGATFREQAGIQFQSTALQDFLTVRETLELFASFYREHVDIDELLTTCSLTDLAKRDNKKLSGGQRQRLLLAVALVNNPKIIFLDEPTTGLDPQARHNFWDLVESIKARNTTILLTTHYMEEAYLLCDHIVIMDHGKIIAEGSPKALLKEHFDDVIIELPQSDISIDLETLPFKVYSRQDMIEISTGNVTETLRVLGEHDIPLENLRIRPRDLEDLFLELTGKELRV
jgi:ABC-2 type transport system ATP-binding protein